MESWGSLNNPEIRFHHAGGEEYTGYHQTWDRWYKYSVNISYDGGYAGLGPNQFHFQIYNETGGMFYNSSFLNFIVAQPTGGPFIYEMSSTESQTDDHHYMDSLNITQIGTNLEDNACSYNIPSFQMPFMIYLIAIVSLMILMKKSAKNNKGIFPKISLT